MNFTVSALALGIIFALVSGIMNGTFTLPMRYLGRWSLENVWAVFILVSCIIMPVAIIAITVPGFAKILATAPTDAVVIACITGFAWGFGAIMFGQGVSAVGISLGNTLVLAISASLGSFLPILLLAPERLGRAQGQAIIAGTLIGIAGIVCCGYAGFLKEKSQKDKADRVRGEMVGHRRPFGAGLALCIGSGLLSAVFNIGYSSAQPVLQTAVHMGYSTFAGSNLVWFLMLISGAVANLCFCAYLFKKNGSFGNYALSKATPLFGLAIAMGLLWGGSIFVYGFAAPKLGEIGPAIGWPLSLIAGLLTANAWGAFAGEWKLTRLKERRWMAGGVLVLLLAIVTLGWSSALG
ncbi:MAG: L-rhamnose/proton symporter RhaT [Bryobacteraceae bacterium]